jgi:hypothetical protein
MALYVFIPVTQFQEGYIIERLASSASVMEGISNGSKGGIASAGRLRAQCQCKKAQAADELKS